MTLTCTFDILINSMLHLV